MTSTEREIRKRKCLETNNHPAAWTEYLNFERNQLNSDVALPSNLARLKAMYIEATENISMETHRNDPQLLQIWLDLLDLRRLSGEDTATLRDAFKHLKSSRLGSKSAPFYIAWAKFELHKGSLDKAKTILVSGIASSAQPSDLLSSTLTELNRTGTLPGGPPVKPEVKTDTLQDKENAPFVRKPLAPRMEEALEERRSIRPPPPLQPRPALEKKPSASGFLLSMEESKPRPLQSRPTPLPIMTSLAPEPSRPTSATPTEKSVMEARDTIYVNQVPYRRLEVIGRGGSSKVYKIISADNRQFALKKVKLKAADQSSIDGYLNEIALLRKLRNNDRIIQLRDSEINETHQVILMVMEYGEIDLANLLKKEKGNISCNFIRMYWEQMLQAVHAIHEENIIHTDLKPANFLLVEGALKLIDFGIAKAIPNDTTNIQREHQTGTVNYMSPESITDLSGQKRQYLKLGRSSDVWSLGCILYQMVYNQPPFASFSTIIKRLQAIIDPSFAIPYPETDLGHDVVDVIQSCLQRDPKKRPTIPQLLSHPFLTGAKSTNGTTSQLSLDMIRNIVHQTIKANAWGAKEEDIANLIHSQVKNQSRIDVTSLCK